MELGLEKGKSGRGANEKDQGEPEETEQVQTSIENEAKGLAWHLSRWWHSLLT